MLPFVNERCELETMLVYVKRQELFFRFYILAQLLTHHCEQQETQREKRCVGLLPYNTIFKEILNILLSVKT